PTLVSVLIPARARIALRRSIIHLQPTDHVRNDYRTHLLNHERHSATPWRHDAQGIRNYTLCQIYMTHRNRERVSTVRPLISQGAPSRDPQVAVPRVTARAGTPGVPSATRTRTRCLCRYGNALPVARGMPQRAF